MTGHARGRLFSSAERRSGRHDGTVEHPHAQLLALAGHEFPRFSSGLASTTVTPLAFVAEAAS